MIHYSTIYIPFVMNNILSDGIKHWAYHHHRNVLETSTSILSHYIQYILRGNLDLYRFRTRSITIYSSTEGQKHMSWNQFLSDKKKKRKKERKKNKTLGQPVYLHRLTAVFVLYYLNTNRSCRIHTTVSKSILVHMNLHKRKCNVCAVCHMLTPIGLHAQAI